jgi:hypothetical protein
LVIPFGKIFRAGRQFMFRHSILFTANAKSESIDNNRL